MYEVEPKLKTTVSQQTKYEHIHIELLKDSTLQPFPMK